MPEQPFPLWGRTPQDQMNQIMHLIEDLYQECLAGAKLGDVFEIGDDDILALGLSDASLEKGTTGLSVGVDPDGGIHTTSDGISIKLKAGGGLTATEDGLSIFSEGYNFRTISCPSGTSPAADQVGDTLTLSAGTGITITGDATVDSITIAAHAQQHAITSTSDHTSTATAAQMLKADANGLPVDASNTDAQVVSAVLANRGHRDGLNVTIKDATNLYISGGSIDIAGVVYTVDEELTISLGTITKNLIHYIYVDAPVSGRTLAAGDFTVSIVAPAFNHTYGALYDSTGLYRSIGQVYDQSAPGGGGRSAAGPGWGEGWIPSIYTYPVDVGIYYSLDGINWIMISSYNFYSVSSTAVKTMISFNNEYPANGGTIKLDDYEYLLPVGMTVWNDTFTGNDGDPPDVSKWTTSNGNTEINSNALTLKATKTYDYLFSIGETNTATQFDLQLKTTIIAGTGSEYKTITLYIYHMTDNVFTAYCRLSHYRDTYEGAARRFIIGYNYVTGEDIELPRAIGDTDIWFRITTKEM